VALEDPPRDEVQQAVERCHGAGLRVIMVTGDHPQTALAVARDLGIVRGASPVVLTGDAVRRMSAAELQIALTAPDIVCARVSAEQKGLIVQALQRRGEIVAVTGDGVNDAPALRRADIGIAMGRSGTDVAREAADVILLDDHFASIVDAIEEGRAVYDNLRKFITYILTSNIPELVPYLAFVLFHIPLPLTVIQILAVDLGTDMLPALALGAERASPEVMQRPPRPRGERLLSWPLLARAYGFLGPLEALAAMACFLVVLDHFGWHYGEALAVDDPRYLQATSACLLAIVLAQAVNLFVCRDPLRAVWQQPQPANPWLAAALASELGLLLLILYTPGGQAAFGTAPVPALAFAVALPGALLLGLAEEGRKAWLRRRGLRRPG
jgi:sodium/potassium-transporting ATPase subunit alpha